MQSLPTLKTGRSHLGPACFGVLDISLLLPKAEVHFTVLIDLNGVDLVTTANELGHANATTTAMIYAHQIAIAKARAADVRAGVFAGRDSKPKGSKLRSKFRGA